MSRPLEHDYIGGLSELSLPLGGGENSDRQNKKPTAISITTSATTTPGEISSKELNFNLNLNLKATELRLGLPGSESPVRDSPSEAEEVGKGGGYTHGFLKSFVSGAKRGFSDAIDLRSEKWVLACNVGSESIDFATSGSVGVGGGLFSPSKVVSCGGETLNGSDSGGVSAAKGLGVETEKKAPRSTATVASKTQVVGWPPIRSFRKNTMATTSPPSRSNADKVETKLEAGCLYVKVSMDGAPYLRKVDLKIYSSYAELSTALEKMFSCFTIGQHGYHGVPGRDGLSESRLMDLLHGSEYVLTYEDKDGDWMLVGDVPWDMFTSSCRRLRITKSSEAIGLAPRAKDKSKNRD